jgi:hypothetical protein
MTRAQLLRQITQCRAFVRVMKRRYPHSAKWAVLRSQTK